MKASQCNINSRNEIMAIWTSAQRHLAIRRKMKAVVDEAKWWKISKGQARRRVKHRVRSASRSVTAKISGAWTSKEGGGAERHGETKTSKSKETNTRHGR